MQIQTIIRSLQRTSLGKSKYIRLLSCSLYNSWYNLRRRGEISISDRKDNASIQLIPSATLCKYSLESLTEALEEILSEEKGFTVSMNQLKFLIPTKRDLNSIEIVLYLSRLISVCKRKNSISRFTSFNSYFVHCDLLDKDENLCNGEPLSVLGCFDITESQFERVNYSPPNPVLQKITPWKDITSIHIEQAHLRLMLTL